MRRAREAFWSTYLGATGDREVLEVIPPFFAWRALVVASPVWYPSLTPGTQNALLGFAEGVLEAGGAIRGRWGGGSGSETSGAQASRRDGLRRSSAFGRIARVMNLKLIAAALGADFRLDARGKALAHAPTGCRFVLVPGGTYAMGFTIDDVRAVWCAVPRKTLEHDARARDLRGEFGRARPPRTVTLPPFLVATTRLGRRAPTVRAARALARKAGFRLLSDAEWEWIARDAGAARFAGVGADQHPVLAKDVAELRMEGPNGLGVEELQGDPEWVDGGGTRFGHIAWQDDDEICALHAAYRGEADEASVRLALDLPGPRGRARPGAVAFVASETVAGLEDPDPMPSVRAIETVLDGAPAADAIALVASVAAPLARMKAGRPRDLVLGALGAAAERSVAARRALAKKPALAEECAKAAGQAVTRARAAKAAAKKKAAREGTPPGWVDPAAWARFARAFYDPKDAVAHAYRLLQPGPAGLGALPADEREARVFEAVSLRATAARKRKDYDVTAEGDSLEIAEKLFPEARTAAVARAILAIGVTGFGGGAAVAARLAELGQGLPEVEAELTRFSTLKLGSRASHGEKAALVLG